MARRIETECAYCAEEIEHEREMIGEDWKVYCSKHCAEMGKTMSVREWQQLMSVIIPTRDFLPSGRRTPIGWPGL